MNSALKRNKVFELLGTKPTNPRWSWCAISPDHRRAVFTLWKDGMTNGKSQLLWDDYHPRGRHGAADQQRILQVVMQENIPAYGLVCIAHDPSAAPRSIKEIKSDFLIRLRIEKVGNLVFGYHLGSVHMLEVAREIRKSKDSREDGLSDLDDIPAGNETPDRASTSSWVVIRDPDVRAYVLNQAKGRCEHCGKAGFLMKSGRRYLEAHHVIALSAKGKDTVDNVIALCPEHHREAHYGSDAESLEMDFLKCIKNRKNKE